MWCIILQRLTKDDHEAFENQLDQSDYGQSRKVHFNRGNKVLDDAMAADPGFANIMEKLIPGGATASFLSRRKTRSPWLDVGTCFNKHSIWLENNPTGSGKGFIISTANC